MISSPKYRKFVINKKKENIETQKIDKSIDVSTVNEPGHRINQKNAKKYGLSVKYV